MGIHLKIAAISDFTKEQLAGLVFEHEQVVFESDLKHSATCGS